MRFSCNLLTRLRRSDKAERFTPFPQTHLRRNSAKEKKLAKKNSIYCLVESLLADESVKQSSNNNMDNTG